MPLWESLDYESERERDMKIWIHKNFCDKFLSPKFARQPKKAMMLKVCQRTIVEKR